VHNVKCKAQADMRKVKMVRKEERNQLGRRKINDKEKGERFNEEKGSFRNRDGSDSFFEQYF